MDPAMFCIDYALVIRHVAFSVRLSSVSYAASLIASSPTPNPYRRRCRNHLPPNWYGVDEYI